MHNINIRCSCVFVCIQMRVCKIVTTTVRPAVRPIKPISPLNKPGDDSAPTKPGSSKPNKYDKMNKTDDVTNVVHNVPTPCE